MMGRAKVTILGAIFGGVLLALVAMGLYLARASLFVPVPGEVVIPGLRQQCTIRFDAFGVPHVEAQSVEDAFFVQGYLHARERFFQMELSRRASAGRLAELLGAAVFPMDERFRRWGLADAVHKQRELLPAEARAQLAAYAAGVNAALTTVPAWRLAPECVVLGCAVEPWTVEDTLGVGLMLQQQLTWAAGEELKRARQLEALGRERAVDLWGWNEEQAQAWIPEVPVPTPGPESPGPSLPVFSGVGSNNWVVGGERSVTEAPILANDPHVGVANPATWYEIHLQAPGLHVAGASAPGAPGVLIGHNDSVAWAFTMVMLDDQDLFRLTLDEAGTQELYDGRWHPLQITRERVVVRGEKNPREVVVKRSIHGPVISESGEALALAWTALRARSPVECFLKLNRADSAEQAMASFATCESLAMNLLVADTAGAIGWQVTGRVPRRGRGAGKLPAPGADPSWAWQGFEPFARNPRVLSSSSGVLATANHDPFALGDFPQELSFPGEFASADRIQTLRTALASRKRWDVEGFLGLQTDTSNLQAVNLLRALRPLLDRLDHPAARALVQWDGQMRAESPEALLWAEFLRALLNRIGADEAKKAGLAASPLSAGAVVRLLAGSLSPAWWDDVATPEGESPETIVGQALEEAAAKAGGRRWGEAHEVLFAHPLGSVPLLGRWFNFGPHPVSGAGPCLNATASWALGEDFAVVSLPSLRFVADLALWDNSRMVLPLGQAGHPWAPHARDQFPLWLSGQAHPMPFSPQAVQQAAVRVTKMVPQR